MGEIVKNNIAIETQSSGDTGALLDVIQSLLADARTALNSRDVLSVPMTIAGQGFLAKRVCTVKAHTLF